MKKIIMAAAIVCAATIANAAAVDWSANAVVDPVATAAAGKNTPANGWLGYVVMANDYATIAADLANGDTSSLVAKHVGEAKTTTNKGAFSTGTATGNVEGGDQTFYLIVLNAGDLDSATSFFTSAARPESINAALPTTITFGSQAAASKDSANWTAMSVPEPTSGLLLLLGMAGLALKRKRA